MKNSAFFFSLFSFFSLAPFSFSYRNHITTKTAIECSKFALFLLGGFL